MTPRRSFVVGLAAGLALAITYASTVGRPRHASTVTAVQTVNTKEERQEKGVLTRKERVTSYNAVSGAVVETKDIEEQLVTSAESQKAETSFLESTTSIVDAKNAYPEYLVGATVPANNFTALEARDVNILAGFQVFGPVYAITTFNLRGDVTAGLSIAL